MLISFFALKWPALAVSFPRSLVPLFPYSLYFVPTAPTP